MPQDNTPEINLDQFECIRCQACCRQDGYVRLKSHEVDAIARFLGLDVSEFIETHTRLTRDRQCLALNDQEDGRSCIFLGEKGCAINPVKPEQCARFPHKWKYSEFETICGWARQQKNKK